jgi:acetoacetyl-CoA synthetase
MERGLAIGSVGELWRWSTVAPEAFWESIWDFCSVAGDRGDGPPLAVPALDATADGRPAGPPRWFPTATVNYARNALARRGSQPALIAVAADAATTVVSWNELADHVAVVARALAARGIGPGDTVCGVLPSAAPAVVAMLAAAAVGAMWASCPPDLSPGAIAERFHPLAPAVVVVADGFGSTGVADRLRSAGMTTVVGWQELISEPAGPDPGAADPSGAPPFAEPPFDAPLWCLFPSGAGGPSAPVVHTHGGIVLEHLKTLVLHLDLGPDDRVLVAARTGTALWHVGVSSLLTGAAVVLFDGGPDDGGDLGGPTLWRLADAAQATCFAADAGHFEARAREGFRPREMADLSPLRTVVSVGPPRPRFGAWVRDAVGPEIYPAEVVGSTSICSALAVGLPTLPARPGEIATRALGCDLDVVDEGSPVAGSTTAGGSVAAGAGPGAGLVTGLVTGLGTGPLADGRDAATDGELIVRTIMPSLPTGLPSTGPGGWRPGLRGGFTRMGAVVVAGRSAATVRPGPARAGTVELYDVVDRLPGIAGSLAVQLPRELSEDAASVAPGGTGAAPDGSELALFVTLDDGATLTDELAARIRQATLVLPRELVPVRIVQVGEIPLARSGEKLEAVAGALLRGQPLASAASLPDVANPEALLPFMRRPPHAD